MKRAWPYALALAVVVTGCYLALAPLLRSLSPAPARSAEPPEPDQEHDHGRQGQGPRVQPRRARHHRLRIESCKTTAQGEEGREEACEGDDHDGDALRARLHELDRLREQPARLLEQLHDVEAPRRRRLRPARRAPSRKNSAVGGTIDQSQGTGFAGPTGDGGVAGGGQTLTPGS